MREAYLYRLWELGQQHLAAGRYVTARQLLESAEQIAWRDRNLQALARLYLPLLEARRQIRHNAVDGVIAIGHEANPDRTARELKEFLHQAERNESGAGIILLACNKLHSACKLAGSVAYESRRIGRPLEALILLDHHGEWRITSPADVTFAAGLPVRFTSDINDHIVPTDVDKLIVPLPPPGLYDPRDAKAQGLHAIARESLLIATEALALKWQSRHPIRPQADEELAWCRLALRIDPACEPVAMRIIALCEALLRQR